MELNPRDSKIKTHYNMTHKKRGRALIFNNQHFDDPSLKKRPASNVDCENLKVALTNLNFKVTVHSNCTFKEIQNILVKVAGKDHSDCDCIWITFITQGKNDHFFAKDRLFNIEMVWSHFTGDKCPTLAGKPKIFVIQSNRGSKLDHGMLTQTDGNCISQKRRRLDEIDGNEDYIKYKIPVHSDFLVAYSTIIGFESWADSVKGSWFIQSLCRELKDYGTTYDLLKLLTFVNQKVAIDFESENSNKYHRKKQISCFNSMLTRILLFRDK
ncbi:CASP7.2 family protein [Megaselia abdita]